MSSIRPEIDFLKSNKVLEKKTECTVVEDLAELMKRNIFRSSDRLGAIGSSPDFSGFFTTFAIGFWAFMGVRREVLRGVHQIQLGVWGAL